MSRLSYEERPRIVFSHYGLKKGKTRWAATQFDSESHKMKQVGIITELSTTRYLLSTSEGMQEFPNLESAREQVYWGVKIGLY